MAIARSIAIGKCGEKARDRDRDDKEMRGRMGRGGGRKSENCKTERLAENWRMEPNTADNVL